MPRIDDLPADRRAVLQLLLKQGKSYDDLAGLLRIGPETVRERARDALDRLGPADGAGLDPDRQDEIADYLLGQQGASQRAATRAFLEGSPEGRSWARTVAGELRPLAGDGLPEIPAEGAEVDEAFGALAARPRARERQQRSSKLGGAILIAAGVLVAVLAAVLLSGGGDDDEKADRPATQTQTTPTQTSTTGGAAGVAVLGQVNLSGEGTKAIAVAQLVRQGQQTAMVFAGQNISRLPAKTVYALWLTRASGAPVRLGFIDQQIPKNGKLQFSGALPQGVDPTTFQRMLLTRETTSDPRRPGRTVLSGEVVKAAS